MEFNSGFKGLITNFIDRHGYVRGTNIVNDMGQQYVGCVLQLFETGLTKYYWLILG